MKNIISSGEAGESLSIVLPLEKRELGSFITSLLGQQQSINRSNSINFDIDHSWLINLHEMINQRIFQQASANLVDFSATVYFENGLKRNISTIDSFKSYIETKKEETIGVVMHWNYLIQFPGKPYPEKQEIRFFARAKIDKATEQARKPDFISSLGSMVLGIGESGFIGYEISHTERTWGDDIESLISNEIDNVIRKESEFRKTIHNCCRWGLAFTVFVACTIYPLYYAINSSTETVSGLLEEYQALAAAPSSLELLQSKIDLVAKMMHANANKSKGVFSMASTFFAPLFVYLTFKFTRPQHYSFFTLSKADNKRREGLLRKERTSVTLMVGAYIFAILAGIIGNYGYSFLLKITG